VHDDLIYDVGMHRGQDTEFYLKKGFRVVAVEANQELCDEVAARLADEVESGRLMIVNKAIAETAGKVTFYRNEKLSSWGTVDPAWARRNAANHNAPSTEVTVEATTMDAILREHGVPYYAKIDIEGLDLVALRGLGSAPDRPRYVSIESDKVSLAGLHEEFSLLQGLGYDRFKIVPQHLIHKQRLPRPAREGRDVSHTFLGGASGAFGEDVPGKWMTVDEALEAYRRIFIRYGLLGSDALIRSRVIRKGLRMLFGEVGWYDTHAKLAGAD